jgi:putative transposase
LRGRPRRRRPPSDDGNRPAAGLAANVLDRQFEVAQPNRKFVADYSYIRTPEGWLYVTVVTCSRDVPSGGR